MAITGAAIILGILGAAAASGFLWVVEKGQKLLFADLPYAWGFKATPWWWVGVLLIVAAGLVLLARKMPGATGLGPLTGFHFDVALRATPSVLVAALATLIAGVALGPEAPLIVVGSALGAILSLRRSAEVRQAMMFLGGAAAISAIFGNPFITGFMILEFMALGVAPVALLIPVLAALASGYIVSIGIWDLPGFGVHSLAIPGLPMYQSIQLGDIAIGLLVALGAGIIAVLARRAGSGVDRIAQRRPALTIFGAAIVTTLVLLLGESLFNINQNQILFSGNSGMFTLINQTSIGIVLFVLLAKAIAYAVALGSGFRGGPIFPVTFLGVAVGVLAHLILPDVNVGALAAAGIAGAAAAFLKLPATAALLGTLLILGAGATIAPFAILGAIVGLIVRLSSDKIVGKSEQLNVLGSSVKAAK